MLGSSSVQFDMRLPLGGKALWTLNMYQPDGVSPFNMSGHTFEYVVRSSPTDASPTPLVRFRSDVPGSPVPAGGGLLSVVATSVQSQLQMSWYPPATLALASNTFYHALWMDYADPVNALNLWWGQFMLDAAAQP